MKIIGFIFARGGSKGVPNKNIKLLGDVPLIAHSIREAKKSKYISDVYVSTDSDKIQEVAIKYGAIVPFLRPSYLAQDDSSELDSWVHIVKNIDDFDIFVSLPTVSPMKTYKDIDSCIEEYLNKKPEILITVNKSCRFPGFNLIQLDEDKYVKKDPNIPYVANRQKSDYFDITTVCYVSSAELIKTKATKNGVLGSFDKILAYEVSHECGVDIDTEIDFLCAEKIYETNIKKNLTFSIKNAVNLSNKTAIVTGGFGNVGKKIVESLIECFCKVIVIDINNLKFNKDDMIFNENNIDFYNVNIEDEYEIIKFVDVIQQKYGKIDVLINCAALVGTSNLEGWAVPFESHSTTAWDKCLNINTRAPFILTQKCIPLLKESDSGSVINISSIYSNHAHNFNLYENTTMATPIAYSVSKAGMNAMTRYLASLYGKDNIRFNNIILGGIARNQPKQFVDKYEDMVPLKRMGTEDDIKGTIIFLASKLSLYVTGQDINVDGGYSIL